MGCLYRRKQKLKDGTIRQSPIWWIKYYQNGRQMRESSGTMKETVARRMLREREGDVERGIPINPKIGRVTFEEAAEDILNDYRMNGRPFTANLERIVNKHLRPYFRSRRMISITTPDIRSYIAHRKGQVIETGTGDAKRTREVSNAQVNRELTALKRMFSLAIEAGKLLHRPKIPLLKEDNVRTGFFEREQFESVRAHLPAHLRPLVTFMYITGWRRNEVTSLEWRQVDFAAGEVRLDPGTTKNDEGRTFPFTTELRELLDVRHEEHERLKKTGHIEPHVFVRVVSTTGSRATRRANRKPRVIGNFRKTWMAASRAAGCPGRIPHDFRRTAVRNLVRAGVSERVAMTMTGHKTRAVFDRYDIVSSGDQRDAARKLDLARQFGDGHNFGHTDAKKASAALANPSQVVEGIGAGDGDRTRDIKLGKLAFYR
jgi:integrase